MRTSTKQKEATKRYVAKHDRLEVLLPKGAKDILRAHVKLMNTSMTQFTSVALKQAIKQDRKMLEEQNNTNQQLRMHKPIKKHIQ